MNKTKINAEIVGHSLSPQEDELISVLCTFPRIILSEVNMHRMLSKNTSSSRAIPFKKMVEAVKNDPFIPIAWQSKHSGMQGSEYLTGSSEIKLLENKWLEARDLAVQQATLLENSNVTKQLCNRLLEPFMWTTMLITGSREGWENFFKLRNPSYSWQGKGEFKSWKDLVKSHFKEGASRDWVDGLENTSVLERLQRNKGQAEIHMMALAESIYDAVNESTPQKLSSGEWHIPFKDKINGFEFIEDPCKEIKVSVAMAAHTSYTMIGGEVVKSYEKWIELHDRLISYDPPHSSPMEHCARAMSNEEYDRFLKGNINFEVGYHTNELNSKDKRGWCNNLKGFIPYRYFIDNKIKL